MALHHLFNALGYTQSPQERALRGLVLAGLKELENPSLQAGYMDQLPENTLAYRNSQGQVIVAEFVKQEK